ncbi:DNA-binding response regulator [Mesorhizobium sp. ES1-1]|uniref:DNA-binding response regulator n=1 Tax=Mesorhizobium sp. ES1-1 TaxID=2876629 RepID=UPI001CC992F5|nr:DNA-binding response regulator [Mesorhizobium sp. ES1-1]MBZ9674448.1 DNA-binding response regulator [Mesorhizobium sp. ES1-1]
MTVGSMVLVIAPNPGFRKSLEFALEAEGYVVDSQAQLAKAVASPLASSIRCAVVDEDAVPDWASGRHALARFPGPIILLVDRPWTSPEPEGVLILVKPLLGNALIRAVDHVIENSTLAH